MRINKTQVAIGGLIGLFALSAWVAAAQESAVYDKPSPAATLHRYPYDVVLDPMTRAPRIRMYAGQPDAEDPAHFTIRYEMWGQTDTLDGTLDDQDNVTLTPRHLPTQPATVNVGGRP